MSRIFRVGLFMQGGSHWAGGSEYIKNIIFALASLPSEERTKFEICLLHNGSIENEFKEQIEPYVSKIYNLKTDLAPLTFQNRLKWKLIKTFRRQIDPRFKGFIEKEKFNFLYPYTSPNDLFAHCHSAAWIFDFQHKYLPQFFTQAEINQRDKSFAEIAQNSSTVVLSSKNAESDFHEFFPKFANKTKVLSFKSTLPSSWYDEDWNKVQKQYCLPERFFIISNQFWQHKNHLIVFQALEILRGRSIYPIIVCTGHIYDYRKPSYCDEILQSIHKRGIANQVYLLGLIPKPEQFQLMRRSLAVIQPSLFEGWSTVVEEAKCLGKQIILSDLPVNIEQDPPYSIFFERYSAENLADIMAELWKDSTSCPNLQLEETGRQNNICEVQEFARNFLKIAMSNSLLKSKMTE